MVLPATPDHAIEDELIDQLVPPLGPPWRRWSAWLVFLAVVVGATWAFTSGTVTPRLVGTGIWSWGGDDPVQIGVRLANGSRVAIEVVDGPAPRPGLRLLGYSQGVESDDRVADPFPIRIEPNRTLVLTAWYEVEDCDQLARTPADDRRIDLQVRIADGPFAALTRTRTIATAGLRADPGRIAGDPQDPPWVMVMAQYACSPG